MTTLVFLLEEPSARDLLSGLLPRLVPATFQVQYLVFEGKQDLEKQLVKKLRGWRAPDSAFVVLRDQDAADCKDVKQRLTELVQLSARTPALVRVACRDLESWVLGDWKALADAFERPELEKQSKKAAYRDPDKLVKAIDDLRTFLPEYQKRDGARRVGPLLDPNTNASQSFRTFCRGVRRLVEQVS